MKSQTASKMFLKICKQVKETAYHENRLFRRELIGHVVDECVNRGIHFKCACI